MTTNAAAATETKDPDLIEIPLDDIALGHDEDGLPKVVAGDAKPAAEAATEKDKDAESEADALLKRLQKEREDAVRERDEALQREQSAIQIAREREAAERAASERAATAEKGEQTSRLQAFQAHWHRLHSDKEKWEAGIVQAGGLIDAYKKDIAKAGADGDHEGAAEAQARLAEAVAHKQDYERALEQSKSKIEDATRSYERDFKTPKAEAETKPEAKADEVKKQSADDWIANVRQTIGGRVADWLSNHKEFVTDGKLNAKVVAFSQAYATLEEKPLNSSDFIKALDEKFFPKAKDADVETAEDEGGDVEVVETPKPTARRVASAPVSRTGNVFSSANLTASQVRLPPKLAAFVKSSGLDPTKYAQQAVADIKAGKLPKNFRDPDYDHQF